MVDNADISIDESSINEQYADDEDDGQQVQFDDRPPPLGSRNSYLDCNPDLLLIMKRLKSNRDPFVIDKFLESIAFQWLEQMCVQATGESVARGLVYQQYVEFCNYHAVDFLHSSNFGKVVRSVYPAVTTRRLGNRGNSKYHYYGLTLKSQLDRLSNSIPQLRPRVNGSDEFVLNNEMILMVHKHYSDMFNLMALGEFEACLAILSPFWRNIAYENGEFYRWICSESGILFVLDYDVKFYDLAIDLIFGTKALSTIKSTAYLQSLRQFGKALEPEIQLSLQGFEQSKSLNERRCKGT